MCEPSHSIIQYPPDDKNDNDQDGMTSLSAQSNVRETLIGKLGQWARRVRGWMHLSKMGSGHSETIDVCTSNHVMNRYSDILSLYEAHWWNRQVKRDGGKASSDIQLLAATDYAKAVSIGNLTNLRNFLEQSILKTDRIGGYVNRFRNNFLNLDGRVKFDQRCQEVLKVKPTLLLDERKLQIPKQSIANFVLGFTRKRGLIVPEWADDQSLWTPALEKQLST